MSTCYLRCDRCQKRIEGIAADGRDDEFRIKGPSAGFYILKGCWAPFQRNKEKLICDSCMHIDPEYQRIYGRNK